MFEVQFFIPVTDNDGVVFTAEHHRAFEGVVVDSFGGFTLYPSTAVGGWADDAGRIYRDRNRVYGVAVRSIRLGGKVGELADFAKVHYRQEAIFLRFLGMNEIIL